MLDAINLFEPGALMALGSVILIDIALAGDNAIIVGALAAGLPAEQRKRVILIGIAAALVLRIIFALAVWFGLEQFREYGLLFGGGVLLLWVAWKMYRELHPDTDGKTESEGGGEVAGTRPAKSLASAAWAVALADVSMSLDNVLAVAGAAREHPGIIVIGLVFSVALMGLAANIIAKLIERYRWIAYVGLALILYVAVKMILDGWQDLQPHVGWLIA
jgi:YjbE family integral membrane protein